MKRIAFRLMITGACLLLSFHKVDYCELCDNISNAFCKKLQKERGLFVFGSGGAFMDDIKEVGFSYISLDTYNVKEARALYIEVMEGFIERFNADEKIRPYLHNYPFTEENLRIRIGFEDENRKHRSDGNIALIFLVNGKVYYEGFDHEKDKFYTLHEEPYATAVEIANGAAGSEENTSVYTPLAPPQ